MKRISVLLACLTISTVACDAGCAALENAGPTLDAVVSRVDVPRLLECAGAGSPAQVATCLGARAMTEGLRIALDEATRLAEDAELAADGGAGAADYTPHQRQSLAHELDSALDRLAVEISAANALEPSP